MFLLIEKFTNLEWYRKGLVMPSGLEFSVLEVSVWKKISTIVLHFFYIYFVV